jgi:hypothetical protein
MSPSGGSVGSEVPDVSGKTTGGERLTSLEGGGVGLALSKKLEENSLEASEISREAIDGVRLMSSRGCGISSEGSDISRKATDGERLMSSTGCGISSEGSDVSRKATDGERLMSLSGGGGLGFCSIPGAPTPVWTSDLDADWVSGAELTSAIR